MEGNPPFFFVAASAMVYLKAVRSKDIAARIDASELAAFAAASASMPRNLMRFNDLPGGLLSPMTWLGRKRALGMHCDLVQAVKDFAKERFGKVPDPAHFCPESIGKKRLRFFMPPMMEEVFGYGEDLRFVAFSYCPRDCRIAYSDGGDELATDGALWMEFVNHPLVAHELGEDRYPTLYG